MQARDKVEGLHNCEEFSQRLECLYEVMQTRGKSFLLLLSNNFPEKIRKTLCYGTEKEKFSPVSKSCPRSLARVISSCFA